MKERCRELGIAGQVMFMGQQDHVNELMMAMDVFLFPSLYEGLGLVIVEAQATGLPCIISENVPAPDLIHTLQVLQLSQSDTEWADVILNPPAFNRAEAQRLVVDGDYDISHEAQKLQSFYLSV